ncbi:hypothetical protein AmaxDRAFT_3774 [Limnospira maxima CS-328]|uniref:Uncharacterized protein n=2 Tax=Limnospira TaxID=2596745 RepID=A0A9P1KD04_9CYAN|nr:hypothetical protein AmaxDRAFT_3774 [Limnospira maxima CS-328]BAI90662.1 hypothetical protein NIES39_E04350 [Arthrospira platensis NIES-39]CDM94209.1 conserved protein of unknown function [Limnospira indica PCC 8005]
MVRLPTEESQPCEWREYKGLNVHEQGGVAFFKDNQGLLEWGECPTPRGAVYLSWRWS